MNKGESDKNGGPRLDREMDIDSVDKVGIEKW